MNEDWNEHVSENLKRIEGECRQLVRSRWRNGTKSTADNAKMEHARSADARPQQTAGRI